MSEVCLHIASVPSHLDGHTAFVTYWSICFHLYIFLMPNCLNTRAFLHLNSPRWQTFLLTWKMGYSPLFCALGPSVECRSLPSGPYRYVIPVYRYSAPTLAISNYSSVKLLNSVQTNKFTWTILTFIDVFDKKKKKFSDTMAILTKLYFSSVCANVSYYISGHITCGALTTLQVRALTWRTT